MKVRVFCAALMILFVGACRGGSIPGEPLPPGALNPGFIDPHVAALVTEILASGDNEAVIAWAGNNLLPEDYPGILRSPGGVLAGHMGNAWDRCEVVRQMLTRIELATRYVIDEHSCTIEADLGDGTYLHVPTSRTDTEPPATSLERVTALPGDRAHQVEFIERIHGESTTDHSLGAVSLSVLNAVPVTLDYQAVADDMRLRLRLGREGQTGELIWSGNPVNNASRHELIIRHTSPTGETTEHQRILFERASNFINQEPDPEQDLYAIWFGSHIVGPAYQQVETAAAGLTELEAGEVVPVAESLRFRAIELAMELDNAARQLFQNTGEAGAFFYDDMRVLIAAQEKRFRDSPVLVPSLDILSNPHHILGNEDPLALQIAFGELDALVEGKVLERATGMPVMTVPEIFASLFQEEANDGVSRQELIEDALQRLLDEGVTGEALIFKDFVSEAQAQVILVGDELLFELDTAEMNLLRSLAGDAWTNLTESVDGVILGDPPDRAWPIELWLLTNGARLDYEPRILHVASPQLALATPTGTLVSGSGTYREAPLQFYALARLFEEEAETGGPIKDRADWHVFNDTVNSNNGTSDYNTPTLSAVKPRLLQWGALRDSFAYYETPLWLAPAIAAGIRAETATQLRFVYDDGTSTPWHRKTLSQFEHSRMSLTINGEELSFPVIIARDATGSHSVTIASQGLTRLVLAIETPQGSSRIDSIITPRELRLRGRVMSYRGSEEVRAAKTYAVGVPNASVYGSVLMGRSWPDGSVDLHVPESAQMTLDGSIAILVDTSGSMRFAADPDCAEDCTSRIEVVATALENVSSGTPERIELSVWGFPPTYSDACASTARNLAAWSLDRVSTLGAQGQLNNAHVGGGTPLTGAVQGALDQLDVGAWGVSRRLIVIADGDNDCPDDLSTVTIPANVQIHTIGVGLTAGSPAEIQLSQLAARTRGSYTRTTNGTDLAAALTAVGTQALLEVPLPEVVATEIEAENHLPLVSDFPVDEDDVEIYLDEAPDRAALANFVAILPGEAFPQEDINLSPEAIRRIEENRARQPKVMILVPDRMANLGLMTDTLGWYEINTETGFSSAVGIDGLHVASAIANFGATVAGLWAGVDSVIGNFSACVLPGCADAAGDVTGSLCNPIQGNASTWKEHYLFYVAKMLPRVSSSAIGQSLMSGVTLVDAACRGGLVVSDAVASTTGSVASSVASNIIGAVGGPTIGFAYSVLFNSLGD